MSPVYTQALYILVGIPLIGTVVFWVLESVQQHNIYRVVFKDMRQLCWILSWAGLASIGLAIVLRHFEIS